MKQSPKAERMYFKADECSVSGNYAKFDFNSGFAKSQKEKNIVNLHTKIKEKEKDCFILEVSTKSDYPLGQKLSAFNLTINYYPLEVIFQASKRFQCKQDCAVNLDKLGIKHKEIDIKIVGKRFSDYYQEDNTINCKQGDIIYFDFCRSEFHPKDCKRLVGVFLETYKNKMEIYQFNFKGIDFDLSVEINDKKVQTFFYDYIYFNALQKSLTKQDLKEILKFNIFTDIEFNHKKSINSQARSCALYWYALKNDKIEYYLQSPEKFKEIYQIYKENTGLLF